MSSNNLTQIRDYINTRMAVVEPDFVEWTKSLEEIGNIPKNLLDKSYHITQGPLSGIRNDDWQEDGAAVILTIFKRAFRDPVIARDTVMQTANCIRLDIIDPKNVESYKSANDGNIESVENTSILPLELNENNDNIIKVEIELNVRLFFSIT